MKPAKKIIKRGGITQAEEKQAIKANDDGVYYSGVYWNDYPVVAKHINKSISGDPKVGWFEHFVRSQNGRVFKKALIINCGNGWVERELHKMGLFEKAIGVDYSEGLIKEARKKAGKRPFKYKQMDINTAKFADRGFDLVINNASGHHIARIDKVYKALDSITKDDAVFVNFDYVGPNRNQYPLWQWLAAKRINSRLPENVKQVMSYPHLPTMLVTDPSEAVHSELVLRSTKRYFNIVEHTRLGGSIAYLLLTHNDNMQKVGKRDVQKWSKFIMQEDKKITFRWPSSSMFDYFVAIKKRPKFYTPLLNRWYEFVEDRRENAAERRGGAYYPLRPKLVQRYTIWKENIRLRRINAGMGEQGLISALISTIRTSVLYAKEYGLKSAIRKALFADTHKTSIKVLRQLLVSFVGGSIAVLAGLLLHRLSLGYKVSAIMGIIVGISAALITAITISSPTVVRRFVHINRYLLMAALVSIMFFSLGFVTLLQGSSISKTRGLGLTFDEITFIPSGYYYQSNGKYFLSPEHPPLVKDIGAIPLYFLGLNQPPEKTREVLLQDYAQYLWGKELLFETNIDKGTEKMMLLSRLSVLMANAVILFILFLSLSKVWQKRTALIAIFLIASMQFVLAHGMLVTMDVMAALMTMLALTWTGIWLRRFISGKGTKKPAILAAVFMAGALLSKFSAILLAPLFVVVCAIYLAAFWKRFKGRRLHFIMSVASILVVTFLLVALWYTWHVRNMTTEDVTLQLRNSYPIDRYPELGREVVEKIADFTILGRGFAEYMHGLFMVNNRIYRGAFSVYFNDYYYGNEGAGPAYFPTLYATKLQITYHLLSLLAIVGGLYALAKKGARRSIGNILHNPEAMLIGIYCLIFGGVALLSTLQIGLRHIFPVIIGFALLTALGIGYVLDKASLRLRSVKLVVLAAFVVISISTLLSFPDYLSYYNALGGGTKNGYKLAADSNYDWGQDIKNLARWQQENKVDKLYFDLFINPFVPVSFYFGDRGTWYKIDQEGPLPSGSYLAVSAEIYQRSKYNRNLPEDKKYSQYEKNQIARVGETIFVFRVP